MALGVRMVLAGMVEEVWEAEAGPGELYIIFSCNIFFKVSYLLA